MAITNHERVGKSLDLLEAGLGPFVDREVKTALKSRRLDAFKLRDYAEDPVLANKPTSAWDVAGLLKLMWETWNDVFRTILGPAERSLVSELRSHRNRWAHQESFSSDDAYRALDSVGRLLAAVSAPQSDELERLDMELLRVRFDEQARGERRRQAGVAIESAATAGLEPWREIVTPHKDVASGRYQQAEFAADLWQVHLGEGTDEYRDPVEFFRRTYLTESLKGLLVGAIHRLAGRGGDPVVQLQTNFGGGKTHSMLALYHLFSGTAPGELSGIDAVLQEAQATVLGTARRVVLVGNKISPVNPVTKADGTVVRTLWGELAWQLGGPKAFARIAADDERATNPGDALRELFNEYGPCLILIDEWVAYARQLHDQSDLPAGSFETQFSFAQALTESAKLANHCLLVISLPASDTSGSPHTRADDVEVGGQRGREALDRLRNVVGRIESSWRPASAEEGFEIVRRRLFEPFSDPAQFKDRDVVARAFAELYRTQHQEFPPECRDVDYEKRIKAAYPIHPEIFDRLYTDWSTLVKFQRTRGVLRLMAAVIHSLWERGDRNALILPANVAIDDPRVQFELTRYLSDNWVPVIERDVDGPGSLPLRLDGEVPNLGKLAASRRVARAIYLGIAMITSSVCPDRIFSGFRIPIKRLDPAPGGARPLRHSGPCPAWRRPRFLPPAGAPQMSSRTIRMTDDIDAYLRRVSVRETDVQRRLREETASLESAGMQICPEQGQLMRMLAGLVGARRAIEVGVFTGYSALCVALALPEDGELVACDSSEEWTAVARRYWAEAGVDSKIRLHLAPALDTLDALVREGRGGEFDIAFIDADKTGYDAYYERCLALLRPGGLVLIDNVLWGGKVAEDDDRSEDTVALRAFNAKLGDDPRIEPCMLPVGDGLTIARKIA